MLNNHIQAAKAENHSKAVFFQPKLTINQPGDVYEQEADAVADKVMRMVDTGAGNNFFRPSPVNIQRKCQHCEEEETKMQRKPSGAGLTQATGQTEDYITGLGSKGSALSQSERSFFEPRMGHDFSNVRIHNDAAANQSAKSVSALAYTHSNNIVFSSKYQPGTDEGKRLMAHELTHVVQQGGAQGHIQKGDDDDDDDAIPPIHPPEPNVGPPELDTGEQHIGVRRGPHGWHLCASIPGTAQGSDDGCIGTGILSRPPLRPGPCASGSVISPTGCCPPGLAPDDNGNCAAPVLPPVHLPTQPAVGPQVPQQPAPPQQGLSGTYSTGTIDDFDVNGSGLNRRQQDAYQRVLSSLRLTMQTCPMSLITVTGYTDAPGREADNMRLSQNRADSIRMRLLVDMLSSTTQPTIMAVGRGADLPVEATTGYSPRNRRVEVQTSLVCPPLGSTMPFQPAFGSGSH